MLYPAPVTQAVLLAVCFVAAFWDLRTRKIPNWLVLTSLLLGLALNWFLYGLGSPGLLGSFKGFTLALLMYLPLYMIRAMGAGDVKFMASVGSLVGAGDWLAIFACTVICGGLLALFLVLIRGRARQTFWNVSFMLGELLRFRAPHVGRDELDVRSGKGVSLPHGVTILAGVICFLIFARTHGPI